MGGLLCRTRSFSRAQPQTCTKKKPKTRIAKTRTPAGAQHMNWIVKAVSLLVTPGRAVPLQQHN